ncbi:MAG: hypothetical protein ACOX3K_05510 [Bacilli bacterium]
MKLTRIEQEALMREIQSYLTGNRIKDRNTLLLEWVHHQEARDQLDDPESFFSELEELIDAYLPLQRKRFTKDMLENAELWVRYLFDRAQRLLTKEKYEDALILLQLLESHLGPKAPDNPPNRHEFFSLDNYYQYYLLKEVLNYQHGVNLTQYDYSTLYYALYFANLHLGRADEAMMQLGIANSWNPVSLPVLLAICEFFKDKRVPDRLLIVGKFAVNVAIYPDEIGDALRFVGFAYYLHGKHEKAYACYYQSLRFGGDTKGASSEINAILLALGQDKTYQLSRRELRDLFAGEDFFPDVSKNALRALKKTIVTKYEEEAFTEVIHYGEIYLALKPDPTVAKLVARAVEKLN